MFRMNVVQFLFTDVYSILIDMDVYSALVEINVRITFWAYHHIDYKCYVD